MTPLTALLDRIENAQLVRRLNDPELAYLFRHTLVHEIAYGSLLKHQRKELNRAVGTLLETLYPDRLDEFAPRLAQHFAEAEDGAKALQYAVRAGDAATHVSANAEALMFYEQARVWAPRTATHAQLRHLYTQRGRTLELTGRFFEAVENYQELQDLGQADQAPELELAAMTALATLYATPNPQQDLDHADTLNVQALELARRLKDRSAEAQVLWNRLLHSYFRGDIALAREYGAQALALARADGDRERIAYVLNDLSRVYYSQGPLADGLAPLEEARPIWRELDNLPMLADNLASTGQLLGVMGDFEHALEFAEQSKQLSETIGNLWNQAYSRFTILPITVDRGDYAAALQIIDEMIALSRESGFGIARYMATGIQMQVLALCGQFKAARRLFQMAPEEQSLNAFTMNAWHNAVRVRVELAEGNLAAAHAALELASAHFTPGVFIGPAPILIALAEASLALAEGRPADVLKTLTPLMELMDQRGARFLYADLLDLSARAHYARDETERAFEQMQQAYVLAKSSKVRRILWQLAAVLSEWERACGNLEAAREYVNEARTTVEFIAAHTPPGFRASFLNQPDVRKLWDKSRSDDPLKRGA